jgi:hypothetical protein
MSSVDDIPILSREDDRALFKQYLARYDVPAYVRRALRVQEAFDELIRRCTRQREEWLDHVRVRLGQLHGLAGDWTALRALLLDDEQLCTLEQLHATLAPQLRIAVTPTSSRPVLRRALRELRASLERFNHRWDEFLRSVDLAPLNALRDGYNRYYILEKECAVRSPRVARHGFTRLEPIKMDELAARFPPLPVPLMKGDSTPR